MRFTKELQKLPHHCVYLPQIGTGHEQGFVVPFGDFDAWDSRLQPAVSVVALHQIAEQVPQAGICKREELERAQTALADTQRELEDLRAQMEHYDKELDAVSYLKGRGYQAVKKSGRPPKTAAKAA